MDYENIAARGDINTLLDPHFLDVSCRQGIMAMDINGRIRNALISSKTFPTDRVNEFLMHIPSLRVRIKSVRQLLKKGFCLPSNMVMSPENNIYHALWLYHKMPNVPYLREKSLTILHDYAIKNPEHAFLLSELDVDLPWVTQGLGMHYRRWYELQLAHNVLGLSPSAWRESMYDQFTMVLGFKRHVDEINVMF